MAAPGTSSPTLPEPQQPKNQQDLEETFSDLMPVEFGGLELSEPMKGTPRQGQQFQTVPTGDTNHIGHDQYPHSHSSANACLDSHCPTLVQTQDSGGRLVCGMRKASFVLGLLCLVLLTGAIAASAVAGSKANSLGRMEQSYKELQASASSICLPPSKNGNMSSIPLPEQATRVQGEALPNFTKLTPQQREYTAPGLNVQFIRECSTDYTGEDMGRIPLTRMEDCMNLCAALKISVQSAKGPCMGVAWKAGSGGYRQGENGNWCYLKCKKGRRAPSGDVESAWITD